MKNPFPRKFVYGTATAAFQIEAAADADGKGPSIWDKFSHTKGKIRREQRPDTICDHYHRYREDIALMKKMGLNAYRLSISWSRIFPEGEGAPNRRGLEFYKNLCRELNAAGITPWATLFHWDLPLALQKKYGGFKSRKVVPIFKRYAETVVSELRGEVKNWITINEPFEFACFGHLLGKHAPGIMSPFFAYFRVMHNLLLAHGEAMESIRRIDPSAKAGITVSMTPIHPKTESPRDRRAAMLANQFMNGITLDPLYRGHYPEELWKKARLFRPRVEDGDFAIIGRKTDFLGLNYYSREKASYNMFMPVINADISGTDIPDHQYVDAEGKQRTSMGWEIYPEGLRECMNLIREQYGNPPLYITETGGAFDDVIATDGKVHDNLRVSLLERYFVQAGKARKEGCDLRGIFVWSLMDNFEWAAGWEKRFGLVYVDHEGDGKRIIKDSGYWYRDFIKSALR
jgi:beta-glucosidase